MKRSNTGLIAMFVLAFIGFSQGQVADIIVSNNGCPSGNVPGGTVISLTFEYTCDGITENANWTTAGFMVTKNGAAHPYSNLTLTPTNSSFGAIQFVTDASGGDTYAVSVSAQGVGTNCSGIPVFPKLVCGGAFLPVDILYFNAEYADDKVLISWATASEQNNDFVHLERSYDGSVFHPISTIIGTGNSNEIKEYVVEDPGAIKDATSNSAYYRLAQYDISGAVNYSNVTAVDLRPAQDVLSIQKVVMKGFVADIWVHSPSDAPAVCELVGLNGIVLHRTEITPKRGYQLFEIPVKDLDRGIYLLRLQQGYATDCRKIFYR